MTALFHSQKENSPYEGSATEKLHIEDEGALTPAVPAADTPPTPASLPVPVLRNISLDLIAPDFSLRYIESSGSSAAARDDALSGNMSLDLAGLARSMGDQNALRLASPPLVEETGEGRYRVVTGGRRLLAALGAGRSEMPCLVYPALDPAYAHTLSVLENVQRLPLHPLEEISALCISRLLANADARGNGAEARQVFEAGRSHALPGTLIAQSLDEMLRSWGWDPEQPEVSWNSHLDELGIGMLPLERRRKLRMLNIKPALQETLRGMDITEAALRSLGTLEPGEQQKVVEALAENPALARKIRRVARARRDGFYDTIDDALAEVQGFAPGERAVMRKSDPSAEGGEGSEGVRVPRRAPGNNDARHLPAYTSDLALEDADRHPEQDSPATTMSSEVQDAVLQLLECGDRLSEAMHNLQAYSGGFPLPEPWGSWSRDTLRFMLSSIEGALTLTELPELPD